MTVAGLKKTRILMRYKLRKKERKKKRHEGNGQFEIVGKGKT